MKRNYLIILIVAVMSFGGFFIFLNDGSSPTRNSGQVLGTVTFNDYSGNSYSLNQNDSKLIIVNSWASWCPFCKKELTDFINASSGYSPKEVTIIAINRNESLSTSSNFTDELKENSLVFLLDSGDKFYRGIGGFTMPETLFMDGNLNILEHKRGAMSEEEIKEKIAKHLKEI